MSDYNYDDKWSTKNDLADSAALKVVDADEFHAEFNLIETAVNTKSNKASNLSDLASASTARTNLGVAIGSDVQAYDADNVVKDVANEYTKTQNFNMTTVADGANIAWDLSQNQVAVVTLAGNRTLDAPSNQVAGATYILIIKQDGTGSRTLNTTASAYKWPGGTEPTLTTAASAVDVLTFVSDGSSMFGVAQLAFS